jgi:hypothetical protein
VTFEQLAALCQEAAADLVARQARPLPATVVLPLAEATRVTSLPQLPEADPDRFDLLARFAADVVRPAEAPCYGFLAEASLDAGGEPVDVLVCVYGARKRGAMVTAAPLDDTGLGEWGEPEPLDPTAMPFLAPLQHAVDAAAPPAPPSSSLPIFNG